ncbi:MAG: nucleoside 2-deoxyribosyltransferase [Chloroflexi bacterium]|nr:nucleoside 2-deoxyribosyltransferase [Chloroflexota bacterium]
MKAYVAIKYHADQANRLLIEALCAALAAAGWDTAVVARDLEQWGAFSFAPDDLMRETFALIELCDLVVIDLTEKGVGVGIEAGYAHARGIPVVTVALRGSDISETLRGISRAVQEYDNPAELAAFFRTMTQ